MSGQFELSRLAVPSAVVAFSSAELPGAGQLPERSPIRSAASSARSAGEAHGLLFPRVRVQRVRFSGFSLFSVFWTSQPMRPRPQRRGERARSERVSWLGKSGYASPRLFSLLSASAGASAASVFSVFQPSPTFASASFWAPEYGGYSEA